MAGQSLSVHGFMPHGMCYLWRPEILWLHVSSDVLIALAYFSIPVAMLIFSARRPDLTYRPVVWLFIAFIVLCGLTHAMAIWTVWTPDYLAQGVLKAATAAASIATAVVLWPLLPRALALPSARQLRDANDELRNENARRRGAETDLLALTEDLERRVAVRTAELERANAALRQFASTTSHDLQAPLRHIGVFAELMRREEAETLSETGGEYLDRISGSVGRMQTLIEVLLAYARLVNTPPSRRSVPLAEAAEAARAGRAVEIDAAGAQLTIGPLPNVDADPVLIEQVFDNLIGNALKYRGEAAPEIEIAAQPGADGFVEVSVADNGPGIDPRHATAIFEMLRRLHADTEGSGVGLAFCKQIIESHGGEIWLDDSPRVGARLVFTLPLAPE